MFFLIEKFHPGQMKSGIYGKKKKKHRGKKSHILIDLLSDAQERLQTLQSTEGDMQKENEIERELGDKPYNYICSEVPGTKVLTYYIHMESSIQVSDSRVTTNGILNE